MRTQPRLRAAAAVAFALMLAAGPASAVDVRGAGATFPAPLYDAWIAAHADANPGIRIGYDAVGSSEGVRRFLAGTVDFGASDAAMTDAQIEAAAAGARLVPATGGMVVLAYNLPGVPSGLKLSREAIAGIFLGDVKQWNDPLITEANPGVELPRMTITQVVRRDGSGTTFAFSNHLSAISPTWDERYGPANLIDWPGLAMTAMGNDGVAGRIGITLGSIGYVEQGFAERLGLPVATLENAAGTFVAPTADAGTAAFAATAAAMPDDLRQFLPDPSGTDAYPIVTYSWLLLHGTYADAAVGDAVRDFVRFGLTEGQYLAEEMGYVTLPPTVAERGLVALGLVN